MVVQGGGRVPLKQPQSATAFGNLCVHSLQAECRLGQPGVRNSSQEGVEKGQLDVAPSFCTALRKLSFEEKVLSWSLHPNLGKSSL